MNKRVKSWFAVIFVFILCFVFFPLSKFKRKKPIKHIDRQKEHEIDLRNNELLKAGFIELTRFDVDD